MHNYRKRIERTLKRTGKDLGIYDETLDQFSEEEIMKVIRTLKLETGWTDLICYIRKEPYMVEIEIIDFPGVQKTDFTVRDLDEYIALTGALIRRRKDVLAEAKELFLLSDIDGVTLEGTTSAYIDALKADGYSIIK